MVCLSVKIGQDTGSSTDPLRSDSLSHWMPQFLSHLLLKTRQFADIQPKIGKFHNYILVFRRYIPMFNQANSGSIQAKSSTNQVKSCSSHHQPDIYIYINPNKSPFSCGFPMVYKWFINQNHVQSTFVNGQIPLKIHLVLVLVANFTKSPIPWYQALYCTIPGNRH